MPDTRLTLPLFAEGLAVYVSTLVAPGYPNRAGYWLRLHLIRQLSRTRSLQQMSAWPPAEAEQRKRAAGAAPRLTPERLRAARRPHIVPVTVLPPSAASPAE